MDRHHEEGIQNLAVLMDGAVVVMVPQLLWLLVELRK
jgi:hypothetical protein